jgi:aspartate aminotransferase
MLSIAVENRCGLLKEIPGIKINVPEGAFYVFPDVSLFRKTLKGTEIQ